MVIISCIFLTPQNFSIILFRKIRVREEKESMNYNQNSGHYILSALPKGSAQTSVGAKEIHFTLGNDKRFSEGLIHPEIYRLDYSTPLPLII